MVKKIEYIAFEDKICPPDWRVEAISVETGDVYITIFSGPDSEKRAVEYAAIKNGKLMVAKPATPSVPSLAPNSLPPAPPRTDEFQIILENGIRLRILPSELRWKYDEHRKTISARPKPAIERIGIAVEKEKV